MSDLFSALQLVGTVLGLWCLVSVVAAAPLVALFRLQSASNELQARAGRRSAWLAASHHPVAGR